MDKYGFSSCEFSASCVLFINVLKFLENGSTIRGSRQGLICEKRPTLINNSRGYEMLLSFTSRWEENKW